MSQINQSKGLVTSLMAYRSMIGSALRIYRGVEAEQNCGAC
jgi:hypothetical protein